MYAILNLEEVYARHLIEIFYGPRNEGKRKNSINDILKRKLVDLNYDKVVIIHFKRLCVLPQAPVKNSHDSEPRIVV
ncbi:hypothetical protein OUZ56_012044 [Daphnia magna]|uniref:Uncharacterized protein n=1 Tax=Daphnia magna TaxID=35525 RepID=A0ABQ9Z1V4_9CRUS|nr:hypothetical protein OUZ56_012044 [Daphnia magna]